LCLCLLTFRSSADSSVDLVGDGALCSTFTNNFFRPIKSWYKKRRVIFPWLHFYGWDIEFLQFPLQRVVDLAQAPSYTMHKHPSSSFPRKSRSQLFDSASRCCTPSDGGQRSGKHRVDLLRTTPILRAFIGSIARLRWAMSRVYHFGRGIADDGEQQFLLALLLPLLSHVANKASPWWRVMDLLRPTFILWAKWKYNFWIIVWLRCIDFLSWKYIFEWLYCCVFIALRGKLFFLKNNLTSGIRCATQTKKKQEMWICSRPPNRIKFVCKRKRPVHEHVYTSKKRAVHSFTTYHRESNVRPKHFIPPRVCSRPLESE